MQKKNKKQTFSWINPKLEIKKAIKYGSNSKGFFTKDKIKKDEILTIFGGYVMTVADEEKLPEEFKDHGVQIHENFVLTIKNKKDINDGFFNHSCNPNAGYKGQIFLVAIRDIDKNEEITFDYAMVLHKAKGAKIYNLKCACGSNICRKHITENDWKNKKLQKKYNGYFQFYLQEKIDKLNKS